MAGSALVSVVAWVIYAVRGDTLIYYDAAIHQMISRRVIESPTPGMGQSGGLWPALIHWLQLPFVWNDWLYRSGLSGSLLSMLAYVVATVLLFVLGRKLTGSTLAGLLAAVLFAANPNVMYMQSTPMTDVPLTGCVIAAVTAFVFWCETEDVRFLAATILAVNLAAGTRYEGWFLWGCVGMAIVYVGLRRHWPRTKLLDYLIYFGVFGSAFMVFWVGWNTIINHAPLGFLRGEYASSDIWVNATDPTVGNLWVSAKTFWYATNEINGQPMVLLGLLGLLMFTWVSRGDPRTCGVYLLLFPFLIYIPLLYTGTRPMHVPQITADAYNVRFALHTAPVFALMTAWLAWAVVSRIRSVPWRRLAVGGTASLLLLATAWIPLITLAEPLAALDTAETHTRMDTARWLGDQVGRNPGKVLMQTVGNEQLLFWSDIPLSEVVYEGTTRDGQWERNLEHPAPDIVWIVMRCGGNLGPDHVCNSLNTSPLLAQGGFRQVFADGEILVYERIGSMT